MSGAARDGWAKKTVDAMSDQEVVECLRRLDPMSPALPGNRPRQRTPLERMIDEATGYEPEPPVEIDDEKEGC